MRDDKNKPLLPVKPVGVELIYIYSCPFCERQVPIISPTKPSMAQCEACKGHFPIVPVDDKTVQYFKIMLANGRAGIDPDFV